MNSIIEKKIYFSPIIEQVILDNEISLALESTSPPTGPNEEGFLAPEYFNNDPFKTHLG